MSAHEDFNRPEPMRTSSDRSFGLTVGGILTIIGLMPLLKGRPARWPALGPGATLLLLAPTRPSLLHLGNLLWTRLGFLLNRFVSPVVIGMMFYLVFTPVGFLFRRLGKDPLRLRFDRKSKSYWIARERKGPDDDDSMANQF